VAETQKTRRKWREANRQYLRAYQRLYYRRNRVHEQVRMNRDNRKHQLRHKYDLSVEAFDALLRKQKKRCAICRKRFTKTPCVDHDHKTQKVRGLIHNGCNFILGYAHDDPKVLIAAAKYLLTFSKKRRKI
jgi:calcineurin-like phosphoesterase family protein